MADDFALRSNPQYKHLFADTDPPAPKAEPKWLPPVTLEDGTTLRNSADGRLQVRKHGNPPVYDLYNIRVVPFARPVKLGLKSFDEVRAVCQREK